MKKYIFENGVMKLNPEYQAANQSTVSHPNKALAIVSSTTDIQNATELQAQQKVDMRISDATISSMNIMQDGEFLTSYQAPTLLDGGMILDQLSAIFAQHEVPIGLVNKLLALSEYNLNFIIDDSGTMGKPTDSYIHQAGDYMKQVFIRRQIEERMRMTRQSMPIDQRMMAAERLNDRPMTRWEEAEDRLHIMADMLAYVPTGVIHIEFLNRRTQLNLDRSSKTPQQFAYECHQQIHDAFKAIPLGQTPIFGKLNYAFSNTRVNTMHYLMTDGEPTDAPQEAVADLVLHRPNPKMNPLTFLSCTGDDDEVEWMKTIEEKAPYTAECDDFHDERNEVLGDQGPAFPYSKGLWLICQLAAAINPNDLDAIDQALPFTKSTLDNLMGRILTEQEYQHYWHNHPQAARKYGSYYSRFATEQTHAKAIIEGPAAASARPMAPSAHGHQQSPYAPPQYAPPSYVPPAYTPGYNGGTGFAPPPPYTPGPAGGPPPPYNPGASAPGPTPGYGGPSGYSSGSSSNIRMTNSHHRS